jgi:LmbE family N-acetylglucosaminyl deacetylase
MTALVVVAHPDDEVLGAGNWLRRHADWDRHILHVTDGAPRDMHGADGFPTREAYAEARRAELLEAMRRLRIPESNCHQCPYPDKDAYLYLSTLVLRVDACIERLQPSIVLSHAYEGGHPDHDAAAFAVAMVRRIRGGFRYLEFPLYHGGPDGEMISGDFLDPDSSRDGESRLSREEREWKAELLGCFRTQAEMLSRLTLEHERLRESPAYDFTRSPHAGLLLYERWGWNVTGLTWRQQALRAESYFGCDSSAHSLIVA